MFQVSGVRCQVSRVISHMSHDIKANSHSRKPSPCKLSQYGEQDAATDLDLDQKTFFFARQFLETFCFCYLSCAVYLEYIGTS